MPGQRLWQVHPLTISVVVLTYNRVARVRNVIGALEQQQYPADTYQVIVVSDGSSDGTHAYLEALSFHHEIALVLAEQSRPRGGAQCGDRQGGRGAHRLH